ncbi:MAG: antA/AntB antirepressor family protein [Patescibacteria group bacterium]
MNEIINIKVVQKSIDNEKKRFVNARELHKWLKVGRQFADWIKDRIEKYDFVEGTDFFKVIPYKELKQAENFDFTILGNQNKQLKQAENFDLPNLADQKSKRGGDVRSIEYILTIDMAKEVAMLENNELGKKVRKYFIKTEERFKQVMRAAFENPKFVNQLSKDFKETREETKDYRKDFTDSIKKCVSVKHYGTYTDMLYKFLFAERAKEYRKLLNLAKKDLTRNTMYEEILFIIGSFETGLAGELEKKYKEEERHLSRQEFIKIFKQFSSTRNWDVYKKRDRKIMATYDEELRSIKHPKLIDYKKEFTSEDIKKLLGQRNV